MLFLFQFDPQLVFISAGFDAAQGDPLVSHAHISVASDSRNPIPFIAVSRVGTASRQQAMPT